MVNMNILQTPVYSETGESMLYKLRGKLIFISIQLLLFLFTPRIYSASVNLSWDSPKATCYSLDCISPTCITNGCISIGCPSLSTCPSTDCPATLFNYNIYYGTVSGVYPNKVSVGNVTAYTVTGLNPGTTYYFVVTDTIGSCSVESGYSNQVKYPPTSLQAPTGLRIISTQ